MRVRKGDHVTRCNSSLGSGYQPIPTTVDVPYVNGIVGPSSAPFGSPGWYRLGLAWQRFWLAMAAYEW